MSSNAEPNLEQTPNANDVLVEDYFFIKTDLEPIEFLFSGLKTLDGDVHAVGEAFSNNLIGLYTTAASIWKFASQTASAAAYMGLLGVTIGVRSSVAVVTGSPAAVAKNAEDPHQYVTESLKEKEWQDGHHDFSESIARSQLAQFLKHKFGRECASNILRQCTAITWGAFEVLASDLFGKILNANPKLTSSLFKDERTKKFYIPKDFVSALEEHDYDLSSHMGEVLIGQHRIDNLETVRCLYDVLFPHNATLREILNAVDLWNLYKIRNLIAHRASVVDQTFLSATNLNVQLGERLRITPSQFETYITVVAKAGLELLNAANASNVA